MFLKMMLGSLLKRRARMLTVFLATIVGTGMASALINFYYDVDLKMTRELRAYGANLTVAPAGAAVEAADAAAPSRHPTALVIDEKARQALNRILAHRPILAQAPYYYVAGKSGATYLTIVGTEADGLHRLNSWWKIDGEWLSATANPPQCMIGRQVARQLGLRRDQTLTVRAGSESGEPELRLRIAGIIETGSSEENQVFVTLPTAWAIGGQNGKVNAIALNMLGAGAEVERLAETIEQNAPGLRARPIRQIAQSESWILAKIKWMMLITTAVILMITAICAMTTLAALVMERGKEVALMKALGAGRARIVRLLLSEALALGATGGLVGYFVGLGGADVLERNLFQSAITVRPILLPLIILIACGLLMLASVVAVRRAMAIQPAALLKGE